MLISLLLSHSTDISDRKDYETAQKKMTADRIEAWKDRVKETEARRVEVEESKKQQELLIGTFFRPTFLVLLTNPTFIPP